jgi:hypothetical protein
MLLVSGCILSWSEIATAQEKTSTPESRKADLEVKKLDLEVKKLDLEVKKLGQDIDFQILLAVLTIVTSVFVAFRTLLGALDQSVHEKRLDLYPKLVEATAPLALYFPPVTLVDGHQCRAMGVAMRTWYFAGGGILLSVEARDAYFKFVEALTKASTKDPQNTDPQNAGENPKLCVPTCSQYADSIGLEKIDDYRKKLSNWKFLDDVKSWIFKVFDRKSLAIVKSWIFKLSNWKFLDDVKSWIFKLSNWKSLDDVKNWKFGEDKPKISENLADKYQDFVFLQRLSSKLRTELSKDLRGRRRSA